MTEGLGLRERKKLQTARMLWGTAIGLFVEHGFDHVTVAQIAAAANVSTMTVFNYFPTKEDLVMRPIQEHVGDAARTVRERAPGESATAALRRGFLAALAEHDAATGLNDTPTVLGVQRLLRATPALLYRVQALGHRSRRLLAEELAAPSGEPDVPAQVAATQLIGTLEVLVAENLRRLLGGETAEAVHPDAVAHTDRAFDLLDTGLRDYRILR